MLCKGNILQCFVLFDLKYGSEIIVCFINMVMQSGKKFVVEKIVYGVMDVIIEKNSSVNVIDLVQKVLDNVVLVVEVKLCCVGGVIYQVLVEVCLLCKMVLVMCWLIDFVCKCGENIMLKKLVVELIDVLENCGGVIKKCEEIYCMVEVNKVFVYYCW